MRFPIPDDAARADLIDRAVEADLALGLRLGTEAQEGGGEAPQARPTYGDIFRAAVLGDPRSSALVEAAAVRDLWVARSYRELLARDALALFGEVRAASTGTIETRKAGAYEIEIRDSANRPDRAYMVITLAEGAAVPTRLAVHPAPGQPALEPLELPAASGGVIQAVLPADHPVLAALRDPERSLHLA